MRFAMKILMIWSLFVFIFLMIATLVKLKRDSVHGGDYLKLGTAGNDENYDRINRSNKSMFDQHQKDQLVVQPEDALSSHVGCESQVTLTNAAANLPNNKESGLPNLLPLTDRSSLRMTMTDTSDESFNEGQQFVEEPEFYAGALKKTSDIFDNSLGPSSRFIESMNAPEQ